MLAAMQVSCSRKGPVSRRAGPFHAVGCVGYYLPVSGKFTISVASGPESDDLFVEVWHEDYNLAIVENDPATGTLTVEIYPPPSENSAIFEIQELREILEQAEQRMAQMGYLEKR